jgi:uncharacterized repeat protein (TIGR01451 family)
MRSDRTGLSLFTRRWLRRIYLAFVFTFLLQTGFIPAELSYAAEVETQDSGDQIAQGQAPAQPHLQSGRLTPETYSFASLSITSSVKRVAVGETIDLTLRIQNGGTTDLTNLAITLPLPSSVEATNDTTRQLIWRFARLAPAQFEEVKTTVRVTQAPPERAVLFTPQAQATELATPVSASAGALFNPISPTARASFAETASFQPETRTVLRSADGALRSNLQTMQ